MSLRNFLSEIKPMRVAKEADPCLEMAKFLAEHADRVVHFKKVKDSSYSVVGNVCCSRENFAHALKARREDLLRVVDEAMVKIDELEVVAKGPCQEVVEKKVDLSKLPIPTYTSRDMGPYITAGVFIAKDPEYGLNASFHRASPISDDKLVARVCRRNLFAYLERAGGELPVAICIGLHPSVLLAAAMPVILEGRITKQRHSEGPFLDITRTFDIVRNEPVIEIDCITHRKDPIYQALVPASMEHELLMGMPREPVIYNAVNKVCSCKNVVLTHGGCSWLHGVVQIERKKADDGRNAIEAAMAAHPSMKHVVVVDEDIDVYDPEDVEWAIATRFLAGKDMVVKHEPGSSLDPCVCEDRMTYKVGLDATIPSDKPREAFRRASVGE